jgi:ElaB/YqjD/DUF883 family membrane-anchored ribosome-binding protein
MTRQIERIKDIAQETGKKAKDTLNALQETGRGKVADIRERGHKTIADVSQRGRKVREETEKLVKQVEARVKGVHVPDGHQVEELLTRINVKELVEKLRADEFVEYGITLRNEVYEKLGIVMREDFEAVLNRLDALEKKLAAAQDKPAAKPARKVPAKG